MWTNTFETEPYGKRGMYFYEPLETAAPKTAQPYCCYINTVVFYEQPYRVIDGRFARYDETYTQWDTLGRRWTDADIGWSALAPFVQHDGVVYELGGGKAMWCNGRWYMQWLGWRVASDDRRLVVAGGR